MTSRIFLCSIRSPMRQLLFILFLFIPSITFAETHNIAIGESIELPTSPFEEITIQKKGILKLKDLQNRIFLTGKKLGETEVQIKGENHNIRVIRKPDFKTYKNLQTWAKGKRGPIIEISNNKPVILGRLLRFQDFLDLENHCKNQCKFTIQAQLENHLKPQTKKYINQLLESHNLPMGDIVYHPSLQLNLGPHLKSKKSEYSELLSPFGVSLNWDKDALAQKPVVQIKLYIAHVKKSFLREWGVEWPSKFTANLAPGSPTTWTQLQISLNALEATGAGHLLASPTLITETGEVAEFHSGGEFPVTTTTQFNNSVQWKRYGLFLKTKPKSNAKGAMSIEIDLAVSSIDATQSSQGVPALIRNEVKTKVNMKRPTPILLSGFLKQQKSSNNQGLPWLSQIPVFKPLFSSGQIYDNESELLFILVPSFYDQ